MALFLNMEAVLAVDVFIQSWLLRSFLPIVIRYVFASSEACDPVLLWFRHNCCERFAGKRR